MTDALHHFPPNHHAALARLLRFAPHAGRTYAARRNFDLGVTITAASRRYRPICVRA